MDYNTEESGRRGGASPQNPPTNRSCRVERTRQRSIANVFAVRWSSWDFLLKCSVICASLPTPLDYGERVMYHLFFVCPILISPFDSASCIPQKAVRLLFVDRPYIILTLNRILFLSKWLYIKSNGIIFLFVWRRVVGVEWKWYITWLIYVRQVSVEIKECAIVNDA